MSEDCPDAEAGQLRERVENLSVYGMGVKRYERFEDSGREIQSANVFTSEVRGPHDLVHFAHTFEGLLHVPRRIRGEPDG